ncbi:hypothetical protein [Halorussus salinisoli]|uniref:hypothetical protein n=1 Tax=Halorussus salinisoli TaxID=2558242 RepID=UPI002A91931D|nr:hypothetical protein [Halorussus salinisoli]
MNWPTREEFTEVRRLLPVIAAVLFVGALALPMWVINVHAAQYPDQVLRVHLYAYPHLTGDYAEMATLNHYVGFYYPDPVYWTPNYEVHPRAVDVPEWSVGPLAFVGVGLLSLFVALAPTTEKLKRGLKWQLAGTVTVFGVMIADIQYRLYQTGHSLDPGAPVMGVDPFTPPLWGTYEVANLTTYSRLGPGAYLSIVAVGLLVVAFRFRNTDVRVHRLPDRFRDRLGRFRRKSGRRRRGGTDENRGGTDETPEAEASAGRARRR